MPLSNPDACQGHPAGPYDPMGQTVYCDGSCHVCDRRPASIEPGRPAWDAGDMVFVAHIAAPGRGVAYACATCGAPFVLIGGTFFDPNDLDPSDLEMQPWEVM